MPKVLVVDDEPSNLELAEALISAEGYQMISAMDGDSAFQAVREQRPDVVMMDIVMPRMNGIEACRKIKTNPLTYATPVVMVTALNSPEEKLKAIKAGADDFISKPFDRMELSARLRSLLRLKTIHDRLEESLVSLKEMQRAREELLNRAAKDVQTPMQTVLACLNAMMQEREKLSPETAQLIEPALFCADVVQGMTADFANIMQMEQDKLRLAYDALRAEQSQSQSSAQAEG